VRGHRDLTLVVGLAVVCAAIALLVPLEAVRVVAAAPLCLVLPGYAIVAASFGPRSLSRGRFTVLVLGISLMTLVLSALVLNYVPGGIRDISWAIIVLVVIAGACRWTAIKRKPGELPYVSGPWPSATPADRLLLGGGALAAIVALLISATVFSADEVVGFTRIAMLPNASGSAVRIGIESNEKHRRSYRLRLALSGRPLLVKRLSLDPGDELELRVRIDSGLDRGSGRLAASLYRESSPQTLYRRVTSWLPAERSG
jgi:hypothetical protein